MDPLWKVEHFHIDPSRPLYEQFVDQIRSYIARGMLAPATRLPSVRDLAQALRVNPTTIMRTYQELDREKLIVTHRGLGTFVTDNLEIIEASKRTIAIAAVQKLREIAESLGLTIHEMIALSEKKEET
ncbi:GntR family transcriptional regulator [Brevibacillus fluminis]|uniref:GntR family transcriptional regulator n=1 Tax=Brevibacillus fluminis TaxID=511487 RepID=A0A3M8DNF3_9BACL|nr:GntR family transcriptional regulator [Brevibacillus fluminis]RNB89606.1 GntR family transcriptional regulator [Brevibacillus fluminis]